MKEFSITSMPTADKEIFNDRMYFILESEPVWVKTDKSGNVGEFHRCTLRSKYNKLTKKKFFYFVSCKNVNWSLGKILGWDYSKELLI